MQTSGSLIQALNSAAVAGKSSYRQTEMNEYGFVPKKLYLQNREQANFGPWTRVCQPPPLENQQMTSQGQSAITQCLLLPSLELIALINSYRIFGQDYSFRLYNFLVCCLYIATQRKAAHTSRLTVQN